MNARALEHLFDDLVRFLDRLGEALRVGAEQPLAIDGRQGIEANSPRRALQQAYRLGWLDDEQRWLKLLEDRNPTSHTYREALAQEIYSRIPVHHAAMRDAAQKLRATS